MVGVYLGWSRVIARDVPVHEVRVVSGVSMHSQAQETGGKNKSEDIHYNYYIIIQYPEFN